MTHNQQLKWHWFTLCLFAFVCGGLLTGCYEQTESRPAPGNGDSDNGVEAPDQAEWDMIRWFTRQGPSGANARLVMTLDAEISDDGRSVRFAWDTYPWDRDGAAHFFTWDGQRWNGGRFSVLAEGGEDIKDLRNIRNGYNDLRIPPAGTRVAFAWTSSDGRERSNLVFTRWP